MIKKNKIYLTFDYELFLGTPNGGIEDCLLNPTRRINNVLSLQNVTGTFYVDFAYLFYLQSLYLLFQERLYLRQIILVNLGKQLQMKKIFGVMY